MAVSKQLPEKKPKPKAAKPATASKPLLSAEFVVDSDDSQDAGTAEVEKPANSKPKFAKLVKSTLPNSQAQPSKKRKLPSPSPGKEDSRGSASGGDSISDDEKRPSKKRALVAQDGSPTPKPKPATARPGLVKSSVKPSTHVKPLNQSEERQLATPSNDSDSEVEESSENDSSGGESGSGSEGLSGSSDRTSLQSPRAKTSVQKSVPQQPTPIYQPPEGFAPTSISLHPASKLSEILAPSSLQGKQLWHITVPESVPISLVKEVSTKDIGNGASVLEYHGAKYGLVQESEIEQARSRALFFPSTQTNDYRPSKNAIIKTLRLQQLVSLPSHAFEPAIHPNRSTSVSESYKKTPRQQPEGLRMRYRPFGASDDSDLESTSEPMPKAPEFRIPAPVKDSSPGKKRKRLESQVGSGNTPSAAKSKKRKQSPQTTAGAIDDSIDIDAIPDVRSTEIASPTKSPHVKVTDVTSNGNLPNGNETKEERKKRRRQKKLEKRDSPSKPATALPLDMKQDAETIQPGEVIENPPAISNATEGAKSITGIFPAKEPNNEKSKRKQERRKRKELEKASRNTSLIHAENVPQRDDRGQIMPEIETAQRDASIPVSATGDGGAGMGSRETNGSRDVVVGGSRVSHREETREERTRRKEEKRRRRMERGNA